MNKVQADYINDVITDTGEYLDTYFTVEAVRSYNTLAEIKRYIRICWWYFTKQN